MGARVVRWSASALLAVALLTGLSACGGRSHVVLQMDGPATTRSSEVASRAFDVSAGRAIITYRLDSTTDAGEFEIIMLPVRGEDGPVGPGFGWGPHKGPVRETFRREFTVPSGRYRLHIESRQTSYSIVLGQEE